MKVLNFMLGAVLLAGVAEGEANRAQPRAYVGLVSAGVGIGYHGWTPAVIGQPIAWLGFEGSALEGTYFLTPRLGVGLVVGEVTLNLDRVYGQIWPNTYFALAPTVTYVTNSSARSFGYATLKLMPYTPGSQPGGASIGLDWAMFHSRPGRWRDAPGWRRRFHRGPAIAVKSVTM